jgi:hypothetical protein
MKRNVVNNSSSIASLAYEPQKRELDIEFRHSRDVYRYFDVSAEEHAEFMAAESKGVYLNHVFKRRGHPFTIVRKRSH